jgi:hypothetical protein
MVGFLLARERLKVARELLRLSDKDGQNGRRMQGDWVITHGAGGVEG